MHNKKLCVVAAITLSIALTHPMFSAVQSASVYAADAYLPDAVVETYLTKVGAYAKEMEDLYNQAGTGQAGLIDRLNELYRYAMILYYLEAYRDVLQIGGCTEEFSELQNYAEVFTGMCERFNNVFGNESSQYVRLQIDIDDSALKSDKNLKKSLEKFCTQTVPNYIESLLTDISTKSKTMKESDRLAKYGVTMSNVCSMLNDIEDMSDNLTNVSPFKSETDVGTTIDFSSKLNVTKPFNEVKKTFNELFAMGTQVLALTGTSAVIKIDSSLGFVANMANVTESNGNVIVPDGVQLSQAYLAILAAGASYTPFSSYVGESSFMAALKSIVSDDATVTSLTEFYNDTKGFRKPLYKRTISNEGVPTGRAELVTIKDFINDINQGAEGALVTIGGKFVYDTNNNYWVYADTYSTNQDNDKIDGPTDDKDFAENADDALAEGTVSSSDAQQAQQDAENNGVKGNLKVNVDVLHGATKGLDITLATVDNKTWVRYTFRTPIAGSCYIYVTIKDNGTESDHSMDDTSDGLLPKMRVEYKAKKLKGQGKIGELTRDAFKKAYNSMKNPKVVESFNQFDITKTDEFKDVFAKSYKEPEEGKYKGQSPELVFYRELLDKTNISPKPDFMGRGSARNSFFDTTVYAASMDNAVDAPEASPGDQQNADEDGNNNDNQHENADTDDEDVTADKTDESVSTGDSDSLGDSDSSNTPENSVTKTVNTTVNTSELSGMSVSAKDVTGIMADKIITSEDKMSEPILLYGTKHARAVDNMTSLLFQNIIRGTVACEEKYNESNDYLYVNSYGDILTDDGMVVLPGIANPAMYKADSKYNPYTAAFMNYYPTILENTNFFQVATENDINKMIIMNDSAELTKNDSLDPESMITNKATQVTSIHDVKATAPISVPNMETTFWYNTVEKKQLLGYDRLIFGDTSRWSADGTGMYSYTPLLIQSQLSCGGAPVFPYNVSDDRDTKVISENETATSYSCAEMIAQNMFHYLTTDDSGQLSNLGRLNDNYIIYYYCISNLNGTSNPLAYANADTYSYDRYVDDAELRKESTLFQVSETIMNVLGKSTQVIGINASAQDPILGPTFALLKEHWLAFMMLLIVVLLFSFARVERNMLQSFILLCACSLFAYLFVCILPTYLPLAYNSIINNVSESLAYEIMAVKAESNDINLEDTTALNDSGEFELNTSSLTLYRVSSNDLADFYAGMGITEEDVVGGKSYIINQEAGLFVEGDCIKINTDSLFKTLEITGTFESDISGYNLKAAKTVSNNVDYYTPYYAIVTSFVDKLNNLTSVYQIPRTVTNYSEEVCKDNYLVYSYVNSMPFLTPGVYDAYTPEDTSALSEDQLRLLIEHQQEESDRLAEVFGDKDQASDWLGIAWFFHDLDPDYQQTIWAQTMYDTGYYYYDEETGTDWCPNEEKINDLCNYINSQTKKFVYKMDSQIGTLSDDVMIKIISLRALTAFTQKVSDMGHWLYPFSLNYQEMSIRDVLNCVMTSDYYTLVGKNMNICSYILSEYGWFHLVLFDVLVILLFIATSAIHLLVPLMYLLLGVLLIIKMVTNSDIKVPIKGYIKCSFITMLCSVIICAGVVLSNRFSGSVACIYFMLAVLLAVLSILETIIVSLFSNIADFGNTSLTAKTEGVHNTFNQLGYRVVHANISARHASRKERRRQREVISNDVAMRYNNNRSVDDFYDDFGHPSFTDNQYGNYYNGYEGDEYDYDSYPYDDGAYFMDDYDISH